MNKRYRVLLPIFVTLLISLACTISLGAPEAPAISQKDLVNTSVAQTLAVNQPNAVQPPTAVATVLIEPPTPIPAGPPTALPRPCNQAAFITENTPDGTQFTPNKSFTKSWRFRNDGTCTWNTNYQLVFYSGDQMGGPAVKNFTQIVNPGEQVDISVGLKSPSAVGTYLGYWKLRSDSGEYFVNLFSVQIQVKLSELQIQPQLQLQLAKPDLKITYFNINPATPTMGVACTVTITARNDGGWDAGAFTLRWYGLSTFPNPNCSWAFPGLSAGASKTEHCTFTFGSWYPINKTSIAYIDQSNQVAESNETNNTATISPFGVKEH